MEERTPNRLIHEKSPYLQQHAYNPVEWYPWGEEAFARAKAEDKPIFLSIGYATCHWCHVMERESFEDEDVAALMRSTVVAVKVDREERPDLDMLYMSFCQAMTGQGGWPLNVVLTPEGRPFFAATYLPKESSFGRTGIKELLERLYVVWSTNRQDVNASASQLFDAVRAQLETPAGTASLDIASLEAAGSALAASFDAEHGGFGGAPKFPSPHNLLFLLREWRRTGEKATRDMVTHTLTAMRNGGIWDHLGGGFHRYATDTRWFLPHFEKMLYDQALLAMAYTEGYQATGREDFKQTARDIFAYVRRDLTGPDGLFYSAEDADSEGAEGTFYAWTTAQIREILPKDDAALFVDAYGMTDAGNWVSEATGQATGVNIPFLPVPLDQFAVSRGLAPEAVAARLARCRETLLAAREKRVRPLCDDKVLTDWNGLMLAALAKAARAFGDAALAEQARQAAVTLLAAMRQPDGRLRHRLRQGEAAIPGLLDDYAFLAWGLLELYQAIGDPAWLNVATELAQTLLDHFAVPEGGFSLIADDAESLIVRQRVFFDAAIPSGNSVAFWLLMALFRLTGRQAFQEGAQVLSRAAAAQVASHPAAVSFLLCGVSELLAPAAEVTVSGRTGAPDTTALCTALAGQYLPEVLVRFETADAPATARVCRAGACLQPVATPDALLAVLQK